MVDGLSKFEYSEKLKLLGLPTLVFRRKRGDLIEMFKHFNRYDKCTLAPSFKPQTRSSKKHSFQLHAPEAKDGTNGIQSNFFYQRVTKSWNDLPSYVVGAKDVNQFKNRLDMILKNDELMYNHKYNNNGD